MRALLVLTPGAMTTVQDLGRYGHLHTGIPQSGVLDQKAASAANALVGNPAEAAVLECTVVGPRFAVLKTVKMAIAGAEMGVTLNNHPINNWTAFTATAGDVLTFGQIQTGCRSYLSISGGFAVPMVMGSMSTYLAGKLGGINGRPLKKGDFLNHFEYRSAIKPVTIPPSERPYYSSVIRLRLLKGPQFDSFGANSRRLLNECYQVSSKADRYGCRLTGPSITTINGFGHTIISEPVVRGNIQVPPDGQPFILWGEQTVGSYAKIATVITPDLSMLAQAIPGDTICFKMVDLNTAHKLYHKWYTDQKYQIERLLDTNRKSLA
jgi:biotin-dependent carboxylase-like uncharacterized protein